MSITKAKADAEIWYGERVCVVTNSDSASVDWHHLEKGLNTKYNLIPLESSPHQGLHRDPNFDNAYVSRVAINECAWKNFDRGYYRRAYGAQRLLSFVYAKRDASASLRHVAGALTSLRPLFSVDFCVDTLTRSAMPVIEKASRFSRAMLAMEISLWLRDTNDPLGGARWARHAGSLFAGIPEPDEVQRLHLARFEMVRAVSAVLLHERSALALLDGVKEKLHDYPMGEGNVELWRAMFHLWEDDPNSFIETVGDAFHIPDRVFPGIKLPATTWWTKAHQLLSMADAAHIQGREEDRDHLAGLAYWIFRSTGVVPAGNLPRESLEWYMKRHSFHGPSGLPTRTIEALAPLYSVLPALERQLLLHMS